MQGFKINFPVKKYGESTNCHRKLNLIIMFWTVKFRITLTTGYCINMTEIQRQKINASQNYFTKLNLY